jgi:hypothetical protein
MEFLIYNCQPPVPILISTPATQLGMCGATPLLPHASSGCGSKLSTVRIFENSYKNFKHLCRGLGRSLSFPKPEAPRFQANRHMKVVWLSALRKYSWYSFMLEVESTPVPESPRKEYVTKKFQ